MSQWKTKAKKGIPVSRSPKPKRGNKLCLCGHGRRSHDLNGKGYCKKCDCRKYVITTAILGEEASCREVV